MDAVFSLVNKCAALSNPIKAATVGYTFNTWSRQDEGRKNIFSSTLVPTQLYLFLLLVLPFCDHNTMAGHPELLFQDDPCVHSMHFDHCAEKKKRT